MSKGLTCGSATERTNNDTPKKGQDPFLSVYNQSLSNDKKQS